MYLFSSLNLFLIYIFILTYFNQNVNSQHQILFIFFLF
nr:MAG TPA: hypothetical protein [Caudoviricetes sp.]